LASPFIKESITKQIIQNRPKNAKISLMTSYKLSYFHRNSSDISALKSFIDDKAQVKNYPKLHAKLYIFDSSKAIVTSGNLTLGGLQNNYECGILTDDKTLVSRLEKEFTDLFNNKDEVSEVTTEVLEQTREILSKVPKENKIKYEKSERDLFPSSTYEPQEDRYDGGIESIVNSLSGWRLEVFKSTLEIQPEIFNLDDVYSFEGHFQKIYPDNKNIRAKIRQQLQELRDIGLIEFVQPGVYRKLWK
jgi:hypothetical protein